MEITVDLPKIAEKAKGVMRSPKKFFAQFSKSAKTKETVAYLIIISFVGSLLGGIYTFATFNPATMPMIKGSGDLALSLLVVYFVSLGMMFIWSGLLSLLLSLFRIEADYSRVFAVFVYAWTPNFLLAWVPIISLFALLYSFYLWYIGLKVVFGASSFKSILVIAVSITMVLLLVSALFTGFYAT